MKNVVAICMNELSKALRLSNFEISKQQHKKCLEMIQLFFFEFPEYDEEISPKEYMIDFQTSLCGTIEDICFEVFGIKNRDQIFRISDSVCDSFMEHFEIEEEQEDEPSLSFELISKLQKYEEELKKKGVSLGLICEYPHIYKMALEKDEKALELVKLIENNYR